jgi:hypothetical protein
MRVSLKSVEMMRLIERGSQFNVRFDPLPPHRCKLLLLRVRISSLSLLSVGFVIRRNAHSIKQEQIKLLYM